MGVRSVHHQLLQPPPPPPVQQLAPMPAGAPNMFQLHLLAGQGEAGPAAADDLIVRLGTSAEPSAQTGVLSALLELIQRDA